jgi:hypothetical protein
VVRSFPSPTNSSEDAFGIKATTIGDTVVISAITDDSQSTNSGVVYLFDGNTGQLLRKINNPHPKAEDRFGISLETFGTNLVIGSKGGTTGAGAAYIFDPTNGILIREFNSPTPDVGDLFGETVATIGNDILVGAPGDDTTGLNVGSVYRFNGVTGDLIATLSDPSPDGADGFGYGLGVTPVGIAIGAPLHSLSALGTNGFEVGGVFLYDRSLNYKTLITPTTPHRQDRFGFESAIAGNGSDLILGYRSDDVGANQDAGSVLVYTVPEPSTFLLSAGIFAFVATRRGCRG